VRENRTHGSEGGETGNSTGLSYPYIDVRRSAAILAHSVAYKDSVRVLSCGWDSRPSVKIQN
jgi:hypothetical protein